MVMKSVSLLFSRFKSATFSFSLFDEELILLTTPCKLQVLLSTPCNVLRKVPSCVSSLLEDLTMLSISPPTPLILSFRRVIVAITSSFLSVPSNVSTSYGLYITSMLYLLIRGSYSNLTIPHENTLIFDNPCSFNTFLCNFFRSSSCS